MSKYAFARSLTYLLVFAGLAMTVLGVVMAVAGLLSYSAILMVPTALGVAVGGLVLALVGFGFRALFDIADAMLTTRSTS